MSSGCFRLPLGGGSGFGAPKPRRQRQQRARSASDAAAASSAPPQQVGLPSSLLGTPSRPAWLEQKCEGPWRAMRCRDC